MATGLRTTVKQQPGKYQFSLVTAAEVIFVLVFLSHIIYPAIFSSLFLFHLVSANPRSAPNNPYSNQKLPLDSQVEQLWRTVVL